MYFSWGNLDGHAEGSGYDFSQAVYNTTPAAAISTNLSLSQDAARANLGTPWRMPTADEFRELRDNCTYIWTTLNGVNGLLFTSNVNGNTLFFPAAGYYNGTSLSTRGSGGFYWSSAYLSTTTASSLDINSSTVNPQSYSSRRLGFSVRAVVGPTVSRRSLDNLSNLDIIQNEIRKDDEEQNVEYAPEEPLNNHDSK